MLLISGSHLPGNVNVTFKDQTGTQCIAKGVFCYVDIMSEIIDQLVGDPQEQAVFFAKLSQGYGLLACNRNITQVNGLWNIQHQGIVKGILYFVVILIKECKISTDVHDVHVIPLWTNCYNYCLL